MEVRLLNYFINVCTFKLSKTFQNDFDMCQNVMAFNQLPSTFALACRYDAPASQVLYLIIIKTLHFLWQLVPSVNFLFEQSSFHWQIP
jgi:hypothetical protein